MKSISQNTQLEVIKQFNEGLPVRTIWKNTGVGVPNIKQIIVDAGIEYNRNKVFKNTEEEKLAVEMYNDGRTFTEIAKHFGKSVDGIRNTLLKLGVNSRGHIGINGKHYFNIHECDHTFFDIIDSEEKAYWLGYLYADGYLYEPTNTLNFGQAEQDLDILEMFKKSLATTYPIRLVKEQHQKQILSHVANCQNFYKISIKSEQLTKGLKDKGCGQTKTFTLTFPEETKVPINLKQHFIRGYFDGDGSFTKCPEHKLSASFSLIGTQNLLLGIQKELVNSTNLNEVKISFANENTKIYRLNYSGIGNFKSFYEYLYKNATIYNLRKKNAAESVINLFNERELNKTKVLDEKYHNIMVLRNQGKSKLSISKELKVDIKVVNKAILNAIN